MTANTSTIDQLIQEHNPFAGHIVVRPQQIWGKSFPDVPSINAHASDAVFYAIEQICKKERETVGITITAEKGLGKSHLMSRIRHHLQTEESTLFIYMSKYDDLNKIKFQVLQNIASSLRAFGNQNVMQWQEIAAALINESREWKYTPQQYIKHFPTWLNKYSNKLVAQLTKVILQVKPEISNPYIIQAILWTLSPDHVNYANSWLSGLELTQEDAKAMGLPNRRKEDRESEALNNIRQILDVVSDYKIPVICFDELDIVDIAENGFTAAQIIANLVKDLYNNLKRGVFLLAMYPETWNDQIRALPRAEAVMDRLVSEQFDRQPIELKFLNSDDIVALVGQWLQDFYQKYQQTPPHPLYPFDEKQLREFGKGKPTVRAVLKWCAENFNQPIVDGTQSEKTETRSTKENYTQWISDLHAVKPYFDNELANVEASIDSLMEEEETIADALWLAFNSLLGKTVEGVIIEKIEEIEPIAENGGFIDFKIIGKVIGKRNKLRLGIDVVQRDGRTITAALRRLIDYKTFDFTRGCLVRSKQIRPGAAQARKLLKKLLTEKGGEWVGLQSQDIKPLLAIWFVWCNRESYELTEEQIWDFIQQKQLAMNNPLIREILSDPSGQEPTNLTDDGLPISIPQPITTDDYIELNL
ncbi:hypothetical protein [Nodularia sp. UHCC 0506]|uniref:hypothetical protein n=1 Tax=Nodularia sp. UHCC 0506 TaxID=3110243 RepID=UPI002B1FDCAF|nr:hypothetical protein [Nodularia sp. UHCC 0506]MEA5513049.1 hypothetical protein [Nodularia sp. UHCC 0506]